MLFYVALTAAGIVTAAVAVWIFRSMMMASKSAYRKLSPGRSGGVKLAHLNSNLGATPAPWGWGTSGGAPAVTRFNRHQLRSEPASPSKSRDWSQYEGYARSGERMKNARDTSSSHVGSVRNVLTGYDMQRTRTDTSSWPYQETLSAGGSAKRDENVTLTEEGDRPTKPWGW